MWCSTVPKTRGKYHLVAYYSKRLPEAVTNYSISELELTGAMANVAAFKHLLRNINFHVYCDHSALVHILKAKREPPTLRLKKLIEKLSEYKFDIYFLKGKEIHKERASLNQKNATTEKHKLLANFQKHCQCFMIK